MVIFANSTNAFGVETAVGRVTLFTLLEHGIFLAKDALAYWIPDTPEDVATQIARQVCVRACVCVCVYACACADSMLVCMRAWVRMRVRARCRPLVAPLLSRAGGRARVQEYLSAKLCAADGDGVRDDLPEEAEDVAEELSGAERDLKRAEDAAAARDMSADMADPAFTASGLAALAARSYIVALHDV